jgi:hypothetical protein
MAEVTFYGDFNCPFCFAENERLVKMGIHRDIDFKGVEHWPELPIPWDPNDDYTGDIVAKEVPRLRERAPDIEINQPASFSNSKPGLIALAEAVVIDTGKAADLRTALFRALWLDCKDIATDEVLDECWASADLGTRPNPPSRDARRLAKVWTVEWSNGPFDRRIPVLATGSGDRLLGLAAPEEIDRFLADTTLGGHGTDVCKR